MTRVGSAFVVGATLLIGCRSDPTEPAEGPTPAATEVAPKPPADPAACADHLAREAAIDVAPAPEICEPLRSAWALLSDDERDEVRGLKIVRDARGPCGDRCPDLAAELMSDAALAYYRVGRHELHIPDAALSGPRWRGRPPTETAIRSYLDALGLPSWEALVERVRRLPGVKLDGAVPAGDPRVFDQIVRRGPYALLGGEVSTRDLLLHELGHAVLLRADGELMRIQYWGSLSDWRERTEDGATKPADGYVGGFYASERPIVASRLVLGLPRGDDSIYLPRPGFATGYAAFDPMEDHAEAFRLAHTDPLALARVSPGKLLALVSTAALADERLVPSLKDGVAGLLRPGVDPMLSLPILHAHKKLLRDHAAALASLSNPTPPPVPADLHPEIRELIDPSDLRLVLGEVVLRPPDAAIIALYERLERTRREREEIERGIEALEGDW